MSQNLASALFYTTLLAFVGAELSVIESLGGKRLFKRMGTLANSSIRCYVETCVAELAKTLAVTE